MKKHIRWPKLLTVLLIVCLCFTGLARAGNYFQVNSDGSTNFGYVNKNGNFFTIHSDGSTSYGHVDRNGNYFKINSDGSINFGHINFNQED